jgi:tRNA 5-methylaminomethyl-2-thiouridine biosynthesis bifunctional protein
MKTSPIVAARLAFEDGVPFAPDFGDVYHARAGALAQARHVFLGGNQLPQRWRGRARFVVLETGFGLGNNFLATWDAWRTDPARCERLYFLSVEKHPLRRDDLARVHAASALPELARQLVEAWPPLTPNLHALAFDEGRVQLHLAFGDVADWLPEWLAEVDAFYLDGFAPARNPAMWDRRVIKALGRLAAPGATVATWSAARPVRSALVEAGFVVEAAPGFDAKRETTVARHEPAFALKRPPARRADAVADRRALVLGAGLAGAWVADALARQGFDCTVVDRHPQPACETSGNPAGLFHGIVTPQDGAHARFNRAAALHAQRAFGRWVDQGVPGAAQGLLRLEPRAADAGALQATLDALGLPADYVQALTAAEASRHAGLSLSAPAWHYPGGGWLAPASLVRALLCDNDRIAFRGGLQVDALQRGGAGWQLLDSGGGLLAEAPVLVLANAAETQRLLGARWPLQRLRGQISIARSPALAVAPRVPLAGAGYAIAPGDGSLVFGATSDADDTDPACRDADHRANLAQLARLVGADITLTLQSLDGRVGFRLSADDRLPVVGSLPQASPAPGTRLEQPRFVPRQPGLFTLTALGSRGITWAPLAAEVLAGWISGAPLPLEASLVDAIDVARFAARAARHAS